MPRATVILKSPADRARASRWVDTAPQGCVVEFRQEQKRRTVQQNAKMWAALTDVSRQVVWYGQKLSAEDWKDVFTASLRKARVVPGIDKGSFVPLGMRTSDMSIPEMIDLIELIYAFGAQEGVTFSDGEGE